MVPARVVNILDQLNTQPAANLESKVLEFKSWCSSQKELSHEIAEATVCLCNAEGGLVIIGVDDKKTGITGLKPCPYPSISEEWVKKIIRDLTMPPVPCSVFKSTDLIQDLHDTPFCDLLIIEVSKTTLPSGHRTHKGISYVRIDTECRPQYFVDQDDYTKPMLDHLSLTNLNNSSIQEAVRNRESVYPHVKQLGHHPKDHLSETDLIQLKEGSGSLEAQSYVPRLAAFLLFGKENEIKTELSAAGTVFTVETPITSPLTTSSWFNIVESIRAYVPLINQQLTKRGKSIPEQIIYELLFNAYIHRCYRTAGPIQIRIRENELEIQNPGGLLGGLTTETLLFSPPIYRNFTLADSARQFGYCEKAGTGIDKVYYHLILDGLDFPYFHSVGNSFSVSFRGRC